MQSRYSDESIGLATSSMAHRQAPVPHCEPSALSVSCSHRNWANQTIFCTSSYFSPRLFTFPGSTRPAGSYVGRCLFDMPDCLIVGDAIIPIQYKMTNNRKVHDQIPSDKRLKSANKRSHTCRCKGRHAACFEVARHKDST